MAAAGHLFDREVDSGPAQDSLPGPAALKRLPGLTTWPQWTNMGLEGGLEKNIKLPVSRPGLARNY